MFKTLGLCLFSSCLIACGPQSASNSIATGGAGPRGPSRPDSPNEPKVCRSTKVLQVLNNGRNIVSRLISDENKIVNWNLEDEREFSTLDFPVQPYRVGPDGRYIIRQINFKKFQVIKFGDNKRTLSKLINVNAAFEPMPSVEFSANGEQLILSYRPFAQGTSHRFDIYDLEKDSFESSLTTRDVLFSKVTRDTDYFVMITRRGNQHILSKIEAKTSKPIFEIVLERFENYYHLDLGADVVLIKGSRNVYAYNLTDGNLLYTKSLRYVHSVSSDGDYAVVAENFDDIKILNLSSGNYDFEYKRPSDLILSTCQLTASPLRLICQDSVNQGKVKIWDLAQNVKTSRCY
jgi:hypothetical protein